MPHYGDFGYSHIDSGIRIDVYDSSKQTVTIPARIDGLLVTCIGSIAFHGCSSLKSITIPDSVTYIGSSAFSDCYSLEKITIPNSVTSISSGAFSDCFSLKSITIPDSVTYIGSVAFHGCSSLTSITVPDSVTYIGSSAFSDCSSLKSINIPDSVTYIGNNAFSGCKVHYYGFRSDFNKIIEPLKNDVNVSEDTLKLIKQIETLLNSKKRINTNDYITKILNDVEFSYRKQQELSMNPIINLITLINSLSDKKIDNTLSYAQKSNKNIANINLQIEIALKKIIILLKAPYVVSPQQIQSFRERLYKAYSDLSGVYFAHTNEKASTKINSAINNFAQEARNENIIFVLDNTLFGSVTNGFLITNKRIYIKEMFKDKEIIPLEQVKKFEVHFLQKYLLINDEVKITITQALDTTKLTDLLEEIRTFF